MNKIAGRAPVPRLVSAVIIQAEWLSAWRYTNGMYPPKVGDNEIRTLIRDLTVDGKLPTGAGLRAALAERYGSRGGVTRIYRLLAAETARLGSVPRSPIGIGLVEQENRNLREQLQLARQREDAHQAYWTRQVTELRQRVQNLEPLVQQPTADAVSGAVRQEVQGAGVRAGQLEVMVRTFGPAAGRPKTGD